MRSVRHARVHGCHAPSTTGAHRLGHRCRGWSGPAAFASVQLPSWPDGAIYPSAGAGWRARATSHYFQANTGCSSARRGCRGRVVRLAELLDDRRCPACRYLPNSGSWVTRGHPGRRPAHGSRLATSSRKRACGVPEVGAGPVACADRPPRDCGMIVRRVPATALPDLRAACRLAGVVRPGPPPPKTPNCSCFAMRSPSCGEGSPGRGWTGRTGRCLPR